MFWMIVMGIMFFGGLKCLNKGNGFFVSLILVLVVAFSGFQLFAASCRAFDSAAHALGEKVSK